MDDATLSSLRAALAASPDNPHLLGVVLRALLARGEDEDAAALLAGRDLSRLESEEDRAAAATALLAAGKPDQALPLANGEGARSLLVRARALDALGRLEDGASAYRRAKALNPTLEDPELEARLGARMQSSGKDGEPGRPRLRVIERSETGKAGLESVLEPEATKVTFTDVGGLEEIKRQIHKRIILPFQKPSLFERFRRKAGGGILLFGPPGCGKTLLARATAGECGATFLNVAISDVLDMYFGESEAKLHALFERARSAAPSVLFFDEVEALGGKRQYSRDALTAKLVSQLLSEMDGFSRLNPGVLVLGATNLPWAVGPAFRRPGRFDRTLFVPPPDRPARERILEIHLADRPVEGRIDFARIAKSTSGFSGADLKDLVESAADAAIEASLSAGGEVPIAEGHFQQALRDAKPTTLEWLTTARNHARYANEAGQYDDVLAFLDRFGKS